MDAAGLELIDFSNMTPSLHHRQSDAPRGRLERAQATVEFAMMLPIVFLVIFASYELGIAFFRLQQLSAAVSEGARVAAVSRTEDNPDQLVEDAVIAAAPSLDGITNITTTSTWSVGDSVTVHAQYPVTIDIPFYSGGVETIDLEAERSSRVES